MMKAYQCENRVFARRMKPLAMMDSVEMAHKLFAHFGVDPIEVKRSTCKGGVASYFATPTISKPPRIRLGSHAPDWIVCHEVAHYVHWVQNGCPSHGVRRNVWHGEWWGSIYVECVRLAISVTYADRLERAFAKAGLRHG